MAIGEELKKLRYKYDLSQEEMSAGVISGEYYSTIEEDKRNVNINTLLEILRRNGITIYEFFSAFDAKAVRSKEIHSRIEMAILTGNVQALDELLELDEVKRNTVQRLELQLVRSEEMGVNALPAGLQRKMRNQILQVGVWDKDTLGKLIITLPLYGDEELEPLVQSILIKDNWDEDILEILASVLIVCAKRMYQGGNYSLVREILDRIDQLPSKPEIALPKFLSKYYLCLLNNDLECAQKIEELIQMIGYQDVFN